MPRLQAGACSGAQRRGERVILKLYFDIYCDQQSIDVAAILHMGETFFGRMLKTYPEMAAMVPRAHFFRSTYILQEALNALHDGDEPLFASAISSYQ